MRDIVFWGKRTYGEFLDSGEAIAINLLAARLDLEQKGIVTKAPHETDRRKEVYTLTEKGLALIPILLEMSGWSSQYDPETTAPKQFVDAVYSDREIMFRLIQDTVRRGDRCLAGKSRWSVVEGGLSTKRDHIPGVQSVQCSISGKPCNSFSFKSRSAVRTPSSIVGW